MGIRRFSSFTDFIGYGNVSIFAKKPTKNRDGELIAIRQDGEVWTVTNIPSMEKQTREFRRAKRKWIKEMDALPNYDDDFEEW